MNAKPTHKTEVINRDDRDDRGPHGFGIWVARCTCGWAKINTWGGRAGAEHDAYVHRAMNTVRSLAR